MSNILETNRQDAQCCICLNPFSAGERQFVRQGCTHDGAHRECLVNWLRQTSRCPTEGLPIQPDAARNFINSATPKIQRLMEALGTMLTNAGCAGVLGLVTAGATEALGLGAEAAAAAAAGSGAAAAAAAAAGSGAEALVGAALGVGAAAAAVVAGRAVVIATGTAAGFLASLLLERMDVNEKNRMKIGCAVLTGSIASLAASFYYPNFLSPTRVLCIVSAVGSAVAAALSWFRS